MCSGSHLVQVDIFPSSVHSILEGVSKCTPSVPIRPCILKVGLRVHTDVSPHRVWLESTLQTSSSSVRSVRFVSRFTLCMPQRPCICILCMGIRVYTNSTDGRLSFLFVLWALKSRVTFWTSARRKQKPPRLALAHFPALWAISLSFTWFTAL